MAFSKYNEPRRRMRRHPFGKRPWMAFSKYNEPRRRMRRHCPWKNLGFFLGQLFGKRPWMAFSKYN
jgi:hypothetical protein